MAERIFGLLNIDFRLSRKKLKEDKPVTLFSDRPKGQYFHTQRAQLGGLDSAIIIDEIRDGVGHIVRQSSFKAEESVLDRFGLESKRGRIYRRRGRKLR